MNLLLDTHAFLWWRMNSQSLHAAARQAIADAPYVFVSAATAWEVAIKAQLGRLQVPESISKGVEASSFLPLPMTLAHAEAAGALPLHHADPFDRMLVAQAHLEQLTLVTHDRAMAPYGVAILWT